MVAFAHYNLVQSQQRWDAQIKRFGGPAYLRRPGAPDRWVTYMPAKFTALERLGGLQNPADRKAVISALDPSTGAQIDPDPSEKETLISLKLDQKGVPQLDANNAPIEDEVLKLVAPPTPVGPNRATPLYWVLIVRA
jgi:hypothetical protein